MTIEFENNIFYLTTADTAYLIHLTEEKKPVHLYYGAKLTRQEDYPQPRPDEQFTSFSGYYYDVAAEFPVQTRIQEFSPCLKVTFPDGTRDLDLRYQRHEIQDNWLVLILKEVNYPLFVTLQYFVMPNLNLIKKELDITITDGATIKLESLQIGSLLLPSDKGNFGLVHLSGQWGSEFRINRQPITPGRKIIDGRLGYTGHAANPFFAVELLDEEGKGACETAGEIWFGALQWSGNWKIAIEQISRPYPLTRATVGLNDYDDEWNLDYHRILTLPALITGYTGKGFGELSRNLHQYYNQLSPINIFASSLNPLKPVLYNSWEAVGFNVNETDQMKLAEKAANIGCEVFVVDDGWFGQRHNDKAGLGDWYVNPEKFPNSLNPLIEQVNKLGMDFGIWVEPEMVNPDSDLYRQHPDWVYHYPNREGTLGRNQLVLNLAREDVQEYTFNWLDKLLGEYNIKYVKWDFNRPISEAGYPSAPQEQQREVWYKHTQALYRLVDLLRGKHPEVRFEACSGGGGRADLGILSHFDQLWTSDNTDPLDRLAIQQGYSLVYHPKTMYCWVTESNFNRLNYSLRYRFHSSFMGSLGIGSDLNIWTEEDFALAREMIALYKEIRPLIQNGDMYRLTPLGNLENIAIQYLSQDKREGVILVFTQQAHFWQGRRRLRLQSLIPSAVYRLETDSPPPLTPGVRHQDTDQNSFEMSGQALMDYGISLKWRGMLTSQLIRFSAK